MKPFEAKRINPSFEDERGKIFDLVDDDEFQHAGIVTFKPGVVRGQHYHKLSKQYNYILKGKIKMVLKDMSDNDAVPKTLILEKGDMVLIPANCYHSLEALEESELLFFTSYARHGNVDYEKDTFRLKL